MFEIDDLMVDFRHEFKVCDRCRGTNLNVLIPRLQKIAPHAKILEPVCTSYCGPGRDYPFVFLNNKPIKGENEDDLIEKIKEILREQ